jgi:AcrR family transcriptional regulator
MTEPAAGRWKQKLRTRKELLSATAQLLQRGRRPTLEEVADQALVSRATAYRYFPSVDSLLVEAALDVALPEPQELFKGLASSDPVERLERAEAALHDMIARNEAPLRLMLANSLEQRARRADDAPVRQNRRTPLIEAALAPSREQFKPADAEMLKAALALVIGTESMVVTRDVLQLDDAKARQVRRWAIRALVAAARKQPIPG